MLLVSESAGIKAVLFVTHTYIFRKEGSKKKEGGKWEERGRETVKRERSQWWGYSLWRLGLGTCQSPSACRPSGPELL